MSSHLYEGWVRHRRYRPTAHSFRYRVSMLYLDLDELEQAFEGSLLFRLERRGLALDYVSDLGSVAYGGVASILRSHSTAGPVVFDELSDRFSAFVQLLQHVADSLMAGALRDETELLALYERWSRTGSVVLAEALMRMGMAPRRGGSGMN